MISDQQLVDAVAIGQITPGPVFTTATFIGYLIAGTSGAIVATVALAVITLGVLLRWRPNPTWLIASGATVGLLRGWLA